MKKSRRATVYFDPSVHRNLRVRAAESGRSISDIVNVIAAQTLGLKPETSQYEQDPPQVGYVREPDPVIQKIMERVELLEATLGISKGLTDMETGTDVSKREAIEKRSRQEPTRHLSLNDAIELISVHLDDLRNMCVKSLSIFGSLARGEFGPGSDIDLLVEFSEPVGFFRLIELKQYLERLFEREVDLATPDALRPEIKDQILKEAIRAA